MQPRPGQMIGRFRLVRVLGEGGMGVVWLAVDEESGASVALKTVKVPRPALVGGIRREIAALARLRHPGIARILDHGLHEGLPWYAMALVEGRSLTDRYLSGDGSTGTFSDEGWTGALDEDGPGSAAAPGRGEAPVREVLTVVRRVAHVLAWLHGEGVVHRDLKPGNVLVDDDGRVVLIDFGLLSRALGREQLDLEGRTSGTAAYASPEAIRGERVDGRSDLYALGCLLVELLTGLPPFGGDARAVVDAHLRRAPTPPSWLRPDLGPEVDALALALLAKDRGARLAYAGDVVERIDATLGDREEPPVRPRLHLHRAGFVGRTPELAALRAAWTRAAAGQGGAVLVTGAAGAGKTRLVAEVLDEATRSGARVLVGAAGSGGGPGGALRGALRAMADLAREGAGAPPALGPLLAVLAAWDPSLGPAPRLPRDAATSRLVGAFLQALVVLEERGPVALAIEDLHLADEVTVEVFARAQGYLARRRVLVVGVARPDAVESLERVRTEQVSLGPLTAPEAGALAAALLGTSELPFAPTAAQPGQLQDWLLAALESGALVRRDERWALADEVAREPEELVTRRLAGLDGASLALVRALAVLGPRGDALGAWLGLDADGVAARLAELRLRSLVDDEDGGAPRLVGAYGPAALAALGDAERMALHGRAADALAGLDPVDHGAVAEHLAAAGRAADAARRGELAASQADAAGALRAAERWCRFVLAIDPSALQRVGGVLVRALTRLGRWAEGREWIGRVVPEATPTVAAGALALLSSYPDQPVQERLRLAGAAVDAARGLAPEVLGRALLQLGAASRHGGRWDDAMSAYDEAVRLFEAGGDPYDAALARADRAMMAWQVGDTERAEAMLRASLAHFPPEDAMHRALIVQQLALVVGDRRPGDEADLLHLEAIRLTRAVGFRQAERAALTNRGTFLHELGRLDEAVHPLREAVTVAGDLGDAPGAVVAAGNLGLVLVDLGDDAGGLEHLDRAIAGAEALGHPMYQAAFRVGRAAGWRLLGRYEDAERDLDAALDLVARVGATEWNATALGERCLLELARGRSGRAWLDRAEALLSGRDPASVPAAHQRVRRALAAFEAGQPERLLRGVLVDDLPAAWRERLGAR